MLVLMMTVLVATYVSLVALGHALLVAVVARCLRDRLAQLPPASAGESLAPRGRLVHVR